MGKMTTATKNVQHYESNIRGSAIRGKLPELRRASRICTRRREELSMGALYMSIIGLQDSVDPSNAYKNIIARKAAEANSNHMAQIKHINVIIVGKSILLNEILYLKKSATETGMGRPVI